MIRRLQIEGYKSLVDVHLELQPLSVLFGGNATGKSNVLDALQLLSRLGNRRTLKEAFEPPCRGQPLESFSFGPNGLSDLLEHERVSFSIEVDVELSPRVVELVNRQVREMRPSGNGRTSSAPKVRDTRLRYRLSVEALPKTGILRLGDEYLAALDAQGEPSSRRKPFLERKDNRLLVRREGQAHPTWYDLHLDHTVLSLPHYPPHHPHLVAMREELASWLVFYFEPRERMRWPNPVREVRHVGLMGEDLAAFLNTLKALNERQFQAVERSLSMLVPSVTGLDVGVSPVGEVELRVREGSSTIPSSVVSEGTLRMLGLLALSSSPEPPGVIGFEEPENGI